MCTGSDSYLYVTHLAENKITIQSPLIPSYLIFEKGNFVGGTPSGNNEVFQTVSITSHTLALRVIDGSREGAEDMDCYLGFSDAQSEPRCYDSTEYAATIFTIFSD